MSNVFSKYIFPVITTINTVSAISAITSLFSATATPLTAFIAVVMTFVSLTGWFVITYEISMAKFRKEREQAKVAKIVDKTESIFKLNNKI